MPVEAQVDVRTRPGDHLCEQVGVVHLAVERALRVPANGRQHLKEGAVAVIRRVAVTGRIEIAAADPWLPVRAGPLMAHFGRDAQRTMGVAVPRSGLDRDPEESIPLKALARR